MNIQLATVGCCVGDYARQNQRTGQGRNATTAVNEQYVFLSL